MTGASRPPGRGAALLARWVAAVTRAPRRVLALAGALAALGGWFAASSLGIDTDTEDMFAPELAFRREHEELKAAFPQFVDNLLVVLDGSDEGAVRRAAAALAQRLRAEPELFGDVLLPGDDPFFRVHGLLYLPLEQLAATAGEITRLAPLLQHLERVPTLGALASALATAVRLAGSQPPPALAATAAGLARAIAAARHGDVETFAWRDALAPAVAGAGGATRAVVVTQPVLDWSSIVPARRPIERLQRVVAELGLHRHGVRVRLTGEVALSHEELRDASAGAQLAGMLSLVLVTAFLWIGLRSLRLVVASLLTLLCGLLWTTAYATAAVGSLNLISIAFAVLYISLGVDFSIHVCLRARELMAGGRDDVEQALAATAGDVGGALLLAALTTALSFLAFVPTAFLGVAELGIIAGGGMMISLLANLTVLPALLCLRPLRPRPSPAAASGATVPGARWLAPLLRRRRAVRHGALIVAAGCVLLLPRLRFDADPLHLRNPDAPSVGAFVDLLGDTATTPYRISVLVDDGARVRALADALAALPTVAAVLRLEDLVPDDQADKLVVLGRLQKALGAPAAEPPQDGGASDGARAALARLRDALEALPQPVPPAWAALHRELAASLTGPAAPLDEALLARIESGALAELGPAIAELRAAAAAGPVTAAALPAALRARWVAPDGRRRLEVRPAADVRDVRELQHFVDSVRDVAPTATGGPVVLVASGRTAVRAFTEAFSVAFAAITIVLSLSMRRARDVVLVLLPLLLAGLMTAGAAAAVGLGFNFANVIALPLLLGMSVDNGIHVVHRFGASAGTAPDLLSSSTARAILFSSLTTLGGFGTLLVSPHPGTASLGLLLGLGILASLLCTLVLLPALLAPPGDTRP